MTKNFVIQYTIQFLFFQCLVLFLFLTSSIFQTFRQNIAYLFIKKTITDNEIPESSMVYIDIVNTILYI
jgi:hypothetical protein